MTRTVSFKGYAESFGVTKKTEKFINVAKFEQFFSTKSVKYIRI